VLTTVFTFKLFFFLGRLTLKFEDTRKWSRIGVNAGHRRCGDSGFRMKIELEVKSVQS